MREPRLAAALHPTTPDRHDMEAINLLEEPFWLAQRRDHSLYTQDDIRLEDLAGLDVLLLSQEHCLSEQVMAACQLTERPETGPMPGHKASSLEPPAQLVGMRIGVTLAPPPSVPAACLAVSDVILR